MTPDRALARRVMAALDRWNLDFDDSGGDALMDIRAASLRASPPRPQRNELEPPTLLALLKHPLFRLGGAHGSHGRRAIADPRTGAAARHAAAGGHRRADARFLPLPR